MVNIKNGTSAKFEVKDNVISCPPPELPNIRGLGSTLFEKMKENGNAVAQIDGLTGKKDTYDVYLKRCIRTAMTMRSKGVTRKDIISICSLNHLNTTVPYIAAQFLGAKVACLDPTLPKDVTSHLLNQVRPKMIFVGSESVQLIKDAVADLRIDTQMVTFESSSEYVQFSEFLKPFPNEQAFVPVETTNVKETALILFSSGTTGFPKGICLSHYGLVARCILGMDADLSVSFLCASIYWISSTLMMLFAIFGGHARVLYSEFDAEAVWHLIGKFRITSLLTVPTHLLSMCRTGCPKGVDASNLHYVFVGGSATCKEKLLEIREVLKDSLVCNLYGMTEISGCAFGLDYVNDPLDMELFLEKPHTLGRPVKGLTYKVVNPETEEALGPNQPGELRIKTDFRMNGYLNLDSSTAWDADGFLKTGDVVYYDNNYSFYYVDRIKEILYYRSYPVIPTKLEAVLLSHPAIECAVVFGLPHPNDGELPTGVVVLMPESIGKITGEDIEKYVEKRVDDVERLRGGVRIARTIYITPTGKLSRRRMKDLVLRGLI